VADCGRNRVIELKAPSWILASAPIDAASCPWDLSYSPNGANLAASVPYRQDPLGAMFGKLSIAGSAPLERELGRPLPALAWRPNGSEIAVSTPTGIAILGPGPAYPLLHDLAGLQAWSLGYTREGSLLIFGHANGYAVLDAAAGYAPVSVTPGDPVLEVAVDPSGIHLALVGENGVSVLRAADLSVAVTLLSGGNPRDAAFASNGNLLAISEQAMQVRLFAGPALAETAAIPFVSSVRDLAFRPGGQRLPVLFVHGHSGDAVAAWYEDGGGDTSFAASILANPQLAIDAYFLQLPVHGSGQNQGRSITEDAEDILAWIEGGADTAGRLHAGILNLPAYAGLGKIAIVAYSQGTLSSRYYIKNRMGSRMGPAGSVRVSEFVALASPNHGVGGTFSCGNAQEPDRALRQLCAGMTATLFSQAAPCSSFTPALFGSNLPGDESFIGDLNGHPLSDSCAAADLYPSEAPRSRPSEADGVLYANLYAAGEDDALVGGDQQALDSAGRRLARLLAPDAANREIPIPGPLISAHARFPHTWEVICTTLLTVSDHQVPVSCTGLTQP
jgi:hypothetical protein